MKGPAGRILAWARRPREERRALANAWLLLAVARHRLHRSGVPAARRAARRLARRCEVAPERLMEIVAAAAVALPGATVCLPRAIVLEALLQRAGRAAELRLGIAPRRAAGEPLHVEAHAWVELDGTALGEDVSRWAPFGAAPPA